MDEMKTTENTNEKGTEKTMKTEKTKKPILLIALTVLVVALIAMNAVFLALQMNSNKKLSQYIDDDRAYMLANMPVTGYQEDGYVVADQYEIKSTTAISDAYISGDSSKLDEKQLKTLEMASAVIDEVIKPEMTLYEKEDAIYMWMTQNLPHYEGSTINIPNTDASEAVSTPYGVLYGKQSVCVGYATTFRLFMNMLGTECHIVHNEGHSWDLVKMDDGSWYHVDIYMDVDSSTHANFNMTDTLCRNGHDWNDEGYLPAANKTTYCYAFTNSVTVTDISQVVNAVFEQVNSDKHESKLFIYRVKNNAEPLYTQINTSFDILSNIFSMTDEYPQFSGKAIYGYWVQADQDTQLYIAQYTDMSQNQNQPGSGDINYEQLNIDMQNLINQIFGTNYMGYGCGEEPVG